MNTLQEMYSLGAIFRGFLISALFAVGTSKLTVCDELDRAISGYFEKNDYNFTLYAMLGNNMASFVSKTKSFKGEYDIKDLGERHTFACNLAKSRNDDELQQMLDDTFGEGFSDQLLAPIASGHQGLGSLKKLREIADEYIELLEWAERTNYPMLPIKSNRKDTMQTFMEAQITARQKHISGLVDQLVLPLPVLLKPFAATKLIEDAKSYEDLDEGMDLDKGTMQGEAQWLKSNPNGIKQMIQDINGFMRFMDALDATGNLL